jgi:hypothetical protein
MYLSSQLVPVWDYLVEMSTRSSGLAVVTGDTGVGKTLLARRLIVDLYTSELDSEFDLLATLSDELHLPRRKGTQAQWETLRDSLRKSREDLGLSIVFSIDGVSSISRDVVTRLDMLSSLGFVLLLGSPEGIQSLEQMPSLYRTAYKTHLTHMGITDMMRMIVFRCFNAGKSCNFLDQDGASLLLSQTNGNPKLVVTHCAKVLESINDLKELPLSTERLAFLMSNENV